MLDVSGDLAMDLGGQKLLQVDKVGGLGFVRIAQDAWASEDILFVGQADAVPGLRVDEHRSVTWQSGWFDGEFVCDASELHAQIVTTSGTTGPPKALLLSRRAISDVVTRLVAAMEMTADIREYVAVPCTFSFGLGRVRAVSAVGGQCFLPDGFRPDEIARMLRSGEINALSAVPTMLRTLIANPELIGDAGRRLRWMEIGSQYMSGAEKKAIRSLFPEAIILQHYGLTEASRSSFLRIDQADDMRLESVGSAVGQTRIRISPSNRIEIAGPHVATGLIRDGAVDPLTEDGWLTTSDLGELKDGNLYYLGRVDDVANIGGIKVSVEHLESELGGVLAGEAEIFATAMSDPLRGQRVGIAIASGQPDRVRHAVRSAAEKFGLGLGDFFFAEVADIPRTATGKVQRGKLAELLEEASRKASVPAGDASGDEMWSEAERQIADLWRTTLNISEVSRYDTFYDLGGDSLSAINFMIRAEQLGLPEETIQRMFSGETVAEIARVMEGGQPRQAPADRRAVHSDAVNAVRGALALLIVVSHWGPFFAQKMGETVGRTWDALSPILRIGTPGFAFVYGMGLSLFFFGQLGKNDSSVKRRLRLNTALLVIGLLLVAAAQAVRTEVTVGGFGPSWPELLFYEVILFYALMAPTSLFWMRLIARSRDRIVASLALAIAALFAHYLCKMLWPVDRYDGWQSLGWHMLVAPYAYPRLLGMVMAGFAAAQWMQQLPPTSDDTKSLAKLGGCLLALGLYILLQLPNDWFHAAGTELAFVAFAGAILLMIAFAIWWRTNRGRSAVFRFLAICGMLAFMIFIGHGIVIPLKKVLAYYGMPETIAILIPLSVVLAILFVAYRRISRIFR